MFELILGLILLIFILIYLFYKMKDKKFYFLCAGAILFFVSFSFYQISNLTNEVDYEVKNVDDFMYSNKLYFTINNNNETTLYLDARYGDGEYCVLYKIENNDIKDISYRFRKKQLQYDFPIPDLNLKKYDIKHNDVINIIKNNKEHIETKINEVLSNDKYLQYYNDGNIIHVKTYINK